MHFLVREFLGAMATPLARSNLNALAVYMDCAGYPFDCLVQQGIYLSSSLPWTQGQVQITILVITKITIKITKIITENYDKFR